MGNAISDENNIIIHISYLHSDVNFNVYFIFCKTLIVGIFLFIVCKLIVHGPEIPDINYISNAVSNCRD